MTTMHRRILSVAATFVTAVALTGCTGVAVEEQANAESDAETTATVTPVALTALPVDGTERVRFTVGVEGMHCGGCAAGLTKVVQDLPGVVECDISFEDGQAVVVSDDPALGPALSTAINGMGYEVTDLASAAGDAPVAPEAG